MPSDAPVLPLGRQLALAAGDYAATIVEVGGGVRELRHRGRPLLDGYAATEVPEGARGQLLAPWPNRVDRGRYPFAGKERQLDLSEPERATAIHGLVRWEAWRVVEQAQDRVRLAHRLHPHPGYPHVLDLDVEHRLDPDAGLTTRVRATNVGAGPAPYGVGAHPYLTAGTPTIDACELLIPAATRLPTDERGIPTGTEPVDGTPFDFRTPRPLGGLQIDYAFTDLARDEDGRATVVLRDPASGAATALWVDESCPWVEVFTGDGLPSRRREGLGVEPMSCPPNALATGTGVVVLAPGATHVASWGIAGVTP